MVVQYIRMALLMISIIMQCIGIEIAYDKHSWDCIVYDNHSCACIGIALLLINIVINALFVE